jgi:hypothetical protein
MGHKSIYEDNNENRTDYNSPEPDKYLKNDALLLLSFHGSDKPGIYRPSNLNAYEYAFNSPVRLIDPFGLWSLNADLYHEGFGGGVTIGKSEGQPFFTSLRFGAGAGYSFGFNPEGVSPSSNPDATFDLGFAGALAYRVGPIRLGKDVHFGVTHSKNSEPLRYMSNPFKTPKPALSIPLRDLLNPKNWLGFTKTGYFALEGTIYPENILPPMPINSDLTHEDIEYFKQQI